MIKRLTLVSYMSDYHLNHKPFLFTKSVRLYFYFESFILHSSIVFGHPIKAPLETF